MTKPNPVDPGSWMRRYKAGQHELVWEEMQVVGPQIRRSEVVGYAEEVALETMRRALANVETIVEELERLGFDFTHYTDGEDIPIPHRIEADHPDFMPTDEFESAYGTLPLSLKFWWKVVGHVQLMGAHPSGEEGLDALCVDGPDRGYIESQYEDWMDWHKEDPRQAGIFRLDIGPDDLHKDNVSGGPPYAIEIPCLTADARLLEEHHNTLFVNYLRLAFKWSGFPGLETHKSPPKDLLKIASKLQSI
ncbi:MAG: hypothetical protein KDB90_09755 [Planctomycetes bacterium]|nr:hypothetical protein [Planctomycetota bacterium]